MIAEGGGFAASLDADSEGEEGKFYVWSKAEIEEVLGAEDARLFCEVYDVTAEGNWEGHTILNRLGQPRSAGAGGGDGARRPCGPSCWRGAPAASAPAGTTRCWPTGTA